MGYCKCDARSIAKAIQFVRALKRPDQAFNRFEAATNGRIEQDWVEWDILLSLKMAPSIPKAVREHLLPAGALCRYAVPLP